jgi:hypothetical protein
MTADATHIRRLFLEPKESYAVRDAAEILCMPLTDVLGWMEVGELEGVDTSQGLMLSWGETSSAPFAAFAVRELKVRFFAAALSRSAIGMTATSWSTSSPSRSRKARSFRIFSGVSRDIVCPEVGDEDLSTKRFWQQQNIILF